MKSIFAVLIFLSAASAQAANYAVVPEAKTEPTCRQLGLVGEFKIAKHSGSSWKIAFASGTEKLVKKKASGVYYSIVDCTVGCMGYAELRLNLNSKDFYYWNSIDRKPEVCKGKVVVN